ncbi:MAG TPA: YCF48-related protein [Candidatus Binataceae bacterium]|nr:YCF48-related protein [Candidatus Binataceae bacterium]
MSHKLITRGGKAALSVAAALILAGLAAGCEGQAQKREIEQRVGTKAEGYPLPVREDYYGAAVADKDNAWVVGSYGTILKITDNGSKVEMQPTPTRSSLFAASASGPNDCVVVGEDGLVLRTTDGGKTWEKADVPKAVDQNLLAIARGKDPSQIWAVGPEATLIHSADGGKTWVDQSLHKDETLNGVTFLDDTTGWVVGEFGVIKKTTDGGKTWTEMDKVTDLPTYFQNVTPQEAYLLGIPKLTEQDLYLFNSAWTSPQNGYIASTGGLILETNDGGANWKAVRTGTENTLFSVATPAGHSAVVVGILGTLARQDGGKWAVDQKTSADIYTWLRCVKFSPDASLGIVTGGKGTVLVSHDGGTSWQMIDKATIAAAGNESPHAKG